MRLINFVDMFDVFGTVGRSSARFGDAVCTMERGNLDRDFVTRRISACDEFPVVAFGSRFLSISCRALF